MSPGNIIQAIRYDAATGAEIAEISGDVLMSCRTEYRLYGGCSRGTLRVEASWGDAMLAALDDEIVIKSGNVPVYAGRVVAVTPEFTEPYQTIELDGWWKRLDEISIVATPFTDRIVFGTADDSDHPTVLTAYAVAQWIFTNLIAPDTSPVNFADFTAPSYPCKLTAGGFAIYAGDKLTKVLETLAAMEDCVVGIDAARRFYFTPRATLEARLGLKVHLAENIASYWRTTGEAWGLSGRFALERRGPNHLAIASRDANFNAGTRSYTYASALAGSRRTASYPAPGVRTGPGARRLARGLFRRFADQAIKIEDMECISGSRRFEPHLGRVDVYNSEVLAASELAGVIDVPDWLGTLKINVTLGENTPDPGSGNPINDPFEPAVALVPPAAPQIATGTGEDDVAYPLPSYEIDEDDGHDGDGDDLHENPDRDEPSDPPGVGVDGVDYGTDTADSTNGAGTTGGAVVSPLRKGVITSVASGPPKTYGVDVLNWQDESTVEESLSGITSWPTDQVFGVADEVWLFYNPTLGLVTVSA